ncbi:Nucleolar protein c7c, putative, partial [Gryllus bimaculatus]
MGPALASVPTRGEGGPPLPPPSSECRFLKINVRHITDGQGVVSGVLLVTPNAVMFDPNVSDPLVIEHGPESYGVIAPMEFVANAAIYHDIAHMRVSSADRASGAGSVANAGPRPEVYHPARARSPGKDSLLPKDETFPELQAAHAAGDGDDEGDGEDGELASSAGSSRDGDAFPKAFDRDRVTPTPGAPPRPSSSSAGDGDSSRQVSLDSCPSPAPPSDLLLERRRSTLDHHWPQLSLDKSNGHHHNHQQQQQQQQPGAGAEDEEPEIIMPSKKVFSDADIILAPKTEWVPPVTTYNTVTGNNGTTHTSSLEAPSTGDSARKKTSSVSFSLESNPESDSRDSEDSHKTEDSEKQETRKNKMLKRLSYPLAWMEGLTGEKDDKDVLTGLPGHQSAEAPAAEGQHHGSVFSKVFSRRSSVGTFIRQPTTHQERPAHVKPPAPKLDYRSMVSVEDMPELFVSFDKLIPRPARSCEDPPLYLRLRMGKPIDKKIPKSTPIMSYGKKKMRPEYWFSVPRNRVDELYQFLLAWVPHLYGDLEEVDPRSRGYELVESDTELWEEDGNGGAGPEGGGRGRRSGSGSGAAGDDADLGDLTRESWEVLSMSEELRRALYASSAGSLDLDPFVPELVGTTEVLSEEHRKQLCRHLPARAEGYVWTLVFSTSQHGFSLNSMYRKMSRLESPILLVIEDTEHNVFGALTSCALKVSDHFYGTGESLLFRFSPEFQVFNWTGDNMYFIKGNNESLAIGAGDCNQLKKMSLHILLALQVLYTYTCIFIYFLANRVNESTSCDVMCIQVALSVMMYVMCEYLSILSSIFNLISMQTGGARREVTLFAISNRKCQHLVISVECWDLKIFDIVQ